MVSWVDPRYRLCKFGGTPKTTPQNPLTGMPVEPFLPKIYRNLGDNSKYPGPEPAPTHAITVFLFVLFTPVPCRAVSPHAPPARRTATQRKEVDRKMTKKKEKIPVVVRAGLKVSVSAVRKQRRANSVVKGGTTTDVALAGALEHLIYDFLCSAKDALPSGKKTINGTACARVIKKHPLNKIVGSRIGGLYC